MLYTFPKPQSCTPSITQTLHTTHKLKCYINLNALRKLEDLHLVWYNGVGTSWRRLSVYLLWPRRHVVVPSHVSHSYEKKYLRKLVRGSCDVMDRGGASEHNQMKFLPSVHTVEPSGNFVSLRKYSIHFIIIVL